MAVPVNSKLPSKKSFSIERIISPSFGKYVNCVLSSEKNQVEPTPERARDSIKPKGELKFIRCITLNVKCIFMLWL